jgi:hypothetical protein
LLSQRLVAKSSPLALVCDSRWIPTWVDADQLDRLIDDGGLLVPALPDAIRPPDKQPLGATAAAEALR